MVSPASLAGRVTAASLLAVRRGIVQRHARLTKAKRLPIQCRHTGGKIVFDSREQAQACADELEQTLGNGPRWAYWCALSRSGHWHMTSTRHPATEE